MQHSPIGEVAKSLSWQLPESLLKPQTTLRLEVTLVEAKPSLVALKPFIPSSLSSALFSCYSSQGTFAQVSCYISRDLCLLTTSAATRCFLEAAHCHFFSFSLSGSVTFTQTWTILHLVWKRRAKEFRRSLSAEATRRFEEFVVVYGRKEAVDRTR